MLILLYCVFFAVLLRPCLGQATDGESFPLGDPRNCEVGLNADSKFFRMEVLPGLGWDNLRNLDQSIVLAYNYSQCKSTNDRKYLIPDSTFVIPLQRSKVDTYSEIITHSLNYTSMTSTSINAGFSAFSMVSGKFSADFTEAKGHFYKDKAVMSRAQIRHLRYIIKSSPDAQLNPAFKSRLWDIASELQSNNPKMARYMAELLIRDYGTHYVHTTYAGAILAQEDFLKDTYVTDYSRDSSSVSASTSANFFGKVGFSFGVSHSSSEETQKSYNSNTTYSHVLTHGGPPFQSKFSVNDWEQGIDNALVAIDREGDPIHYAITPQNVPEVPPSTVLKVAEVVKHAVKSYYRHNTHKGCTDPSSLNFNYQANIDDKSCKAPAMNFSFGGVFQTCEKTTRDAKDPLCPGLLQKNPLTKGYSCPQPQYTAVLLNTGTTGTTYKVTNCYRSCHGATVRHCSTNCVTNTIYSGAQYKTYWCVALGEVPPQTGYLFGGVYTPTLPNPLTRTQECPAQGMDGDQPCVYLCSNSLGLMPKNLQQKMEGELDKWAKSGVYAHFKGKYPWAYFEDFGIEEMAKIVGAKKEEVTLMNGLTVNLHQSLVAFYRPTPTRYKILCEHKAFPSDHYAFESQIRLHGYDPADALLCVKPREGEMTWRTEDILKVIEEEGESIALIMLSGVHYFTGQCFDIKSITLAGHSKNCFVGFDLAHAVGNVELFLHDWNVDVACWCTYKYLSGGGGSTAGFYIHEKYATDFDVPRLLGWWAHKMDTRFKMDNVLELRTGAAGFQITNTSPFASMGVVAAMEVFGKTSMSEIRQKSLLLTGYLELLLDTVFGVKNGDYNDRELPAKRIASNVIVEIITPRDPAQRGCQLSLRFSHPVKEVHEAIKKLGVVVDTREPNLMRVAPYPLVNTFTDVFRFVELLKTAFANM